MPAVSSELQSTILAKQRDGATITQIAQELGLSRTTVYKALDVVNDWEAYLKDKSSNINRLALNAVEKACKRGDARIGLAWLEHTVLAPQGGDSYHIHGDVSLVNATTMVPTSTTSLPMSTGTPGSTPTEAPAKPGIASLSLSNHTNFSEFSLAELEQHRAALDAELARRRSQVIDAEVVP